MVTFVMSLLSAIACLILYKFNSFAKNNKIGMLGLFFAGAALMWLVDVIFEFAIGGIGAFAMESSELLSEILLGAVVILIGIAAWGIILLISNAKEKRTA